MLEQKSMVQRREVESTNAGAWSVADEWGPEKVIRTYDPETRMQGVLVIDNTAIGPGKGGIRFQPTVTELEIFRLARAMTWKCALAGLPFGGAKSGIRGDPARVDKLCWIKAFARAIRPYVPSQYIGAPDIGTSEVEMASFANEVGDMRACTGKPTEIGGIPHELGTTGYGVAIATDLSIRVMNKLDRFNLDPKEAKVVIQGFGNVGSFTAKFLDKLGYKIVAASDITACIKDPQGIDILRIMKELRKARSIADIQGYKKEPKEKIFNVPADIFIPAAVSDTLNEKTVKSLLSSNVRMVVEAANIPTTMQAEGILYRNGVWVIPYYIVNAGGVIGSYVEYRSGTKKDAFNLIRQKLTKNLKIVIEDAVQSNRTPRIVAKKLAISRVRKAMLLRKGIIDVPR